jgi:pyruvate/2-oxoacid:ferredoxin oxidoreductase alpha subunit
MKAKKGQITVMMGNAVTATAAALCRPDVIACYPITPQSEVAETISGIVADGKLDAEIV